MFEGTEAEKAVEAARRTYSRSVKVARETMEGLVLGKAIGARRAERAVLTVVDQVLQEPATMMGMLTLRDFDDHSYVHSVNVSILSVALGDYLGLNREQLFELGFAEQRVRLEVYGHLLPSSGDAIEWIRGSSLTRFFSRLPDDLHEPLVEAVRDEFLAEVLEPSLAATDELEPEPLRV